MKNLFLISALLLTITSCKKAVESVQEDLIIKAMTDGEWKVTKFTNNGTDVTADFSTYRFKFQKNNTVDAIKGGTTEKTGTWSADAPSRTITSGFANAATTLTLLNGTWKITNNSWTFVEASQTAGSETRSLRLDK